jgi:hypothetical protein
MVKKKKTETQVPTQKDESFYVGIKDPTQFRREILSASKNIIISLKQIEILREQRKHKEILQGDLAKKIREINFLVGKIRGLLPEHKLRSIPSELLKGSGIQIQSKQEQRKKEDKVNNQVKQKHLTELDKLERELALIESKMKSV